MSFKRNIFVSVCILICQNGKIKISFKRHSFVLISILTFQIGKIDIVETKYFCLKFYSSFSVFGGEIFSIFE